MALFVEPELICTPFTYPMLASFSAQIGLFQFQSKDANSQAGLNVSCWIAGVARLAMILRSYSGLGMMIADDYADQINRLALHGQIQAETPAAANAIGLHQPVKLRDRPFELALDGGIVDSIAQHPEIILELPEIRALGLGKRCSDRIGFINLVDGAGRHSVDYKNDCNAQDMIKIQGRSQAPQLGIVLRRDGRTGVRKQGENVCAVAAPDYRIIISIKA